MLPDDIIKTANGELSCTREDSQGQHSKNVNPGGFRLALLLVALLISNFVCALDLTIVSSAIPRIADEFHSLDQIGWYGSFYFLANAASQNAWSKSCLHLQTKSVFVAAFATFEIGSLICGVAQNSNVFIIGRTFAGIGRAGISCGVSAILPRITPLARRNMVAHVMEGVYAVATAVGPFLGGLSTNYSTWRWCFFLDLPLGVMASLIVLICLHNVQKPDSLRRSPLKRSLQLDPIGIVVIISSMLCYLYAMRWGGVIHSWHSEGISFLLTGFAIFLFFGFATIEWMMKDMAMMRLDLLLKGQMLVNLLCAFLLSGSYFSLLYFLPIQYQAVDETSPTASGLWLLPLVLTISIFTIVSSVSISICRRSLLFQVIGPLVALPGTVLILLRRKDVTRMEWIMGEALTGIGIGLALHVPLIRNQNQFKSPADILAACNMTHFAEHLGAAIFVMASQTAFMNNIHYALNRGTSGLAIQSLISAGATQFRETFTEPGVAGMVLEAYREGLNASSAVAVVCAGMAGVLAFGMVLVGCWKRTGSCICSTDEEDGPAPAEEL
ncbi:MAG: hypothetical protein Q9227_003546 [Pyrenula ochraceoflavens]